MDINEKLVGQIVYFQLDELTNYVYNEQELSDYIFLNLKGGVISDAKNKGALKIIFDIIGTQEYWDGYVIGFFYTDGKFLGKFHYIVDAKSPDEQMNGTFNRIEKGYEIRGIFNQGEADQKAFYLKIVEPISQHTTESILSIPPFESVKEIAEHNKENILSISKVKLKKQIIRKVTKAKNKQVTDTIQTILNNTILEKLIAKSKQIKKNKAREGYDLYSQIISWNTTPNTIEDLVTAMCIAYSWMPTMLDVYIKDKKELRKLLVAVKGLGIIKTLNDFEMHNAKIEAWLLQLTLAINNSIVGTSKVLHIFYHPFIPIMDSSVLKGWNIIFKKHYKKYPTLELPNNIPSVTHRQIRVYMAYWKLLLMMKHNTKSKSIRQLEEPFYWIGMK